MKVVPAPWRDFRSIVPLISSTLFFHNVHTDATARYVRDFCSGGEAGSEDQTMDLGVRHRHGFGSVDDIFFEGLGAYAFGVEAGAVVADFDNDVAAFMIGAQLDRPIFALAFGGAVGGRFDAMVARVADHVRERVLDQFENLAI